MFSWFIVSLGYLCVFMVYSVFGVLLFLQGFIVSSLSWIHSVFGRYLLVFMASLCIWKVSFVFHIKIKA